jgi:hypothetical protein
LRDVTHGPGRADHFFSPALSINMDWPCSLPFGDVVTASWNLTGF